MGDSLCIQSGPFANYTNPLGPGYKLADHCIERRLNDFLSQNASKEIVDSCLKKDTYLDFWNCVETRPHGAGHGGVGAEVSLECRPIHNADEPRPNFETPRCRILFRVLVIHFSICTILGLIGCGPNGKLKTQHSAWQKLAAITQPKDLSGFQVLSHHQDLHSLPVSCHQPLETQRTTSDLLMSRKLMLSARGRILELIFFLYTGNRWS